MLVAATASKSESKNVNNEYIVAIALTAGLAFYLFFALLAPEKF
jgi:K+-transporting ATPase KdpF subunit